MPRGTNTKPQQQDGNTQDNNASHIAAGQQIIAHNSPQSLRQQINTREDKGYKGIISNADELHKQIAPQQQTATGSTTQEQMATQKTAIPLTDAGERTPSTFTWTETFHKSSNTGEHIKQLKLGKSKLMPKPEDYTEIATNALELSQVTNRMITPHALLDILYNFNNTNNKSWGAKEVIDFAIAVANQGASDKAHFVGRVGDSEYQEFASFIKASGTTIRRVCRLYAPIVFDTFVRNGTPPNSWARLGYSYEDKYAAFDFFDGIFERGSIKPPGGMFREPTPGEIRANNLHSRIAITEAARNNYVSSSPRFTAAITQASSFQHPTITYNEV